MEARTAKLMIDLHCHILPNLDDGPQSVEEAVEMARFCVADGIDRVVATPHCHRYIHLLKDAILPSTAEFNARLAAADVPLKILPGSEIQVTDADEYRGEFDEGVFCHLGGGSKFTLLEFNWSRELYPKGAPELVRWILGRGMTPILAHPERFTYFWEAPELLDSLVDAGAWIQVTVDSLLGNHGPSPFMAAEGILQRHSEIVLATDAHNLHRCSGLAAGYEWVEDQLGEARRADLMARAEKVAAAISK
jgi:protein-tyrosine phosphatase